MSSTIVIFVGILIFVGLYLLRKSRALSPEKLQQITQALEDGATLVDVRTQQEFEGGHTKGAINIPLHRLSDELRRLQQASAPVVVCCASGMRSARAAKQLRRAGVQVLDLGGRANWPD